MHIYCKYILQFDYLSYQILRPNLKYLLERRYIYRVTTRKYNQNQPGHIELQLNLILEKKDISGSTSNRSQTFMSIINWRYNLITFMAFWAIDLFLLFKQSLTLLEGNWWLSWIKVFYLVTLQMTFRFCVPAQSWTLFMQRYQ